MKPLKPEQKVRRNIFILEVISNYMYVTMDTNVCAEKKIKQGY